MYYEKFFPFYTVYQNPLAFDGEQLQEQEFLKMKTYFPEMAGRIQEEVEMTCELLDYPGSRIYDEYPDRMMLKEMAQSIWKRMESGQKIEGCPERFLKELIEVLLYQEITRRRCRRHRCKKYYY